MLLKDRFNVSIKKTQRLIRKLGIKSIIVKKYRPTSKKKPKEGLEKVLKRDFTITGIKEISRRYNLHKNSKRWLVLFSFCTGFIL